MLRKVFALVISLLATIMTASAQTPPNNEIWYTTTDGRKLDDSDPMPDFLVSHSFHNGKGVFKFSRDVIRIGDPGPVGIDDDAELEEWWKSLDYHMALAFGGHTRLKSVTIPKTVTRIIDYAFSNCVNLRSITIPTNVTEIGREAFRGCTGLTSITIPNSVTEIGYEAFKDCTNLRSITIPEGVNSIGYCAFLGCSSLTSITIPESVTSIEEYSFYGCPNLKRVNISNLSVWYKISFGECGNPLCNGANLYVNDELVTDIVIPSDITSVNPYLFHGCTSIRSVVIPKGVTSIGVWAFTGCSSLTNITIPESVTSIGNEAFRGCSSLESVKVSNKYCYDYFKKLGVSDITFMISTLEEYEEAQKLGATKITIDSKYASEDGLCLIDNGKLILFIGKNLTGYTIPESVTSIGEEAFEGCSGLKSVKVSNRHCYDYFKDKVADIAFYGANASPDGRCLIINSELIQLISHGLKEYVIPNSITKISSGALSGCNNLQSISIPNSVTSIGRRAFAECTALQHIDVGCNLKLIDNNTLGQISSITLLKGVSNVAHLKQFDNIRSYKGECASSDGRCLIDNGKLIHFINDNITRYAIPQGVTHVGENVFGYMHNLTLITIPDSVTSIGEGAFYGCSGLTSITIPENVTWIGDNALNCYNLESITCKAMTPPTISFPGIGDKVIIYVPKDAVKTYKKDKNWMQYSKRIKRIKE